MNEKLRGSVEMTAAMAILGTIGWFVVLSGQPVIDVVFWRCAFGAATLLVICAAMGLLRGRLSPRTLGLAALGGVAIVANWLLLFGAYGHASISIATAVYNTQPFMLVGFGALFFGERITLAKLFWLALAFGGMLLIVEAKAAGEVRGTDYLIGIVMALGAAFLWAVASVVASASGGSTQSSPQPVQKARTTIVSEPGAMYPSTRNALAWHRGHVSDVMNHLFPIGG